MEKELNKWTGIMSARPACPVCKKSTLTDELQDINGFIKTKCKNPKCCARVFMTPKWEIYRAERHYWPNGWLIP